MDESVLTARLLNPSTRRIAFEEMVRVYGEPLYWKIRRMVLTHEDADDILQNTFMKAWSNLDHFAQRSKLSTWLYRIAINESLDFLRRKRVKNHEQQDEYSTAECLMADEWFDGDLLHARLLEAVALLPDSQRTIFNLRYFDEMKYKEIAELLERSEGTIKASYHIAVEKIKAYFQQFD